MALSPCIILDSGAPMPAGSNAVLDIDVGATLLALALARPSLRFYGDETCWVHGPVAGVERASAWPSRAGPTSYAQATTTAQGVYQPSGGPGERPGVNFSGVADATGTNYAPNWPAPALAAGMTVIDVAQITSAATNQYLWGQASGTDSQGVRVYSGGLTAQNGAAAPLIPIASVPLGAFVAIISSIATKTVAGVPTAMAEVHCNGERRAASSTTLPTTPRSVSLGGPSSGAAAGRFGGKFLRRAVYDEWIGDDRTFFHDVIGELLKLDLALASNPVIAA